MALLFIDLDNFKAINDSLGHLYGDALLKAIAERLAESVRGIDTVSRQGGDEFLIMLGDVEDAESVTPLITRILERIQEPCHHKGHDLISCASIGVAVFPDDGEDFDTLLKKADTAMYRATGAGRNTWRFFDPHMDAEGVEDAQTCSRLRALGCDLAQGHHFARPLPADEVTRLLMDATPHAAPALEALA